MTSRFKQLRSAPRLEALESRRLLAGSPIGESGGGGNSPPAATIAFPAPGATFEAGDTIDYGGSASDPEDGPLPASAYSWEVVFHHDDHTHPFLGPVDGVTGGEFEIPTVGETSANIWYRVHLTVTDSGGLTHATYHDIFPNTSEITLATSPPGISVSLDGQPRATPTTVLGVVGFTRNLAAPSNVFFDGRWHQFVSWSDGGDRVHDITTPASDTTYTATYALDAFAPTVTASAFDYDGVTLPDPPHRIRFTFSEDVSGSIANATLVLTNTTTGQTIPASQLALASWDANTNTITYIYTGSADYVLPDGNYVATLGAAGITDPAGQAMQSDHELSFRVLAGDANGDRRVNLGDFNVLAANFGHSPRTFSQADFSYDGQVDLADFNILAARFGTSLGHSARGQTGSIAMTKGTALAGRAEDPLEALLK